VSYQPYYLAYCRAHGRDPEEQHAHDVERYPGGCMAGFTTWITGRWVEWRKANGLPTGAYAPPLTPEQREAFGEWLEVAS
jgi:hypothetical protein